MVPPSIPPVRKPPILEKAPPRNEKAPPRNDKTPPRQATFLIGPPIGPDDMKVLYQQAADQAQKGDDSLRQQLSGLRQKTIEFALSAKAGETPMINKIFEEKLGKQLTKFEVAVAQSFVRGEAVHSLTVSLVNSAYADGKPIAADFSPRVVKTIEASLAFVFKAAWVQSTVA